jgi:hypothetical protein
MSAETRPAIFLHSGFRSGSTWFWHRFRKAAETYAYYEPFHETLASLRLDPSGSAAAGGPVHLRHPGLDAPYHEEYRPLLRPTGGLPFYDTSMAIQRYFDTGPNPEQHRHVDTLVRHARDQGKVPVLGFCRSLCRVGWFRAYCPGLNIVTLRHPWNRFLSYHEQTTGHRNTYFAFFAYSVAVIGRRHRRYGAVFAGLDLPDLAALAGSNPGVAIRAAFDALGPEQRLQIFLRVFVLDMMLARRHADLVVDLDRMTRDAAYRAATTETLRSATGLADLSFHDCALPDHGEPNARFRSYLAEAQAAIYRSYLTEPVPPLGRDRPAVNNDRRSRDRSSAAGSSPRG